MQTHAHIEAPDQKFLPNSSRTMAYEEQNTVYQAFVGRIQACAQAGSQQ